MKTTNSNNFNSISYRKLDQINKLKIYNQILNNKSSSLNIGVNELINNANNYIYYKDTKINSNIIVNHKNKVLTEYYKLRKFNEDQIITVQKNYFIYKSKFLSNIININNPNNYQVFYQNRVKLQNLNSYLVNTGKNFKNANIQPIKFKNINKIINSGIVHKYRRLKSKYYRFIYKYNNYSIRNTANLKIFDLFVYNQHFAKFEYLKKMKMSLKNKKLNRHATAFFNRKINYFFRQFQFKKNNNNYFFKNKQKSKIKNNIYKIINSQYFSEINKQ